MEVEFFAIEIVGSGRFYRMVRNVSAEGLFFETPPGWEHAGSAPVVLELEPPVPTRLTMRVEGEIAHASERGVGLKLVRLSPAARAWIRRLTGGNA